MLPDVAVARNRTSNESKGDSGDNFRNGRKTMKIPWPWVESWFNHCCHLFHCLVPRPCCLPRQATENWEMKETGGHLQLMNSTLISLQLSNRGLSIGYHQQRWTIGYPKIQNLMVTHPIFILLIPICWWPNPKWHVTASAIGSSDPVPRDKPSVAPMKQATSAANLSGWAVKHIYTHIYIYIYIYIYAYIIFYGYKVKLAVFFSASFSMQRRS